MSRRKKPAHISPIVDKIQKLESKEHEDTITEKEAYKLDDLRTQRRQQQLEALPKLTCCDAGRTCEAFMYHIDVYESGPSNQITEGRWRIATYESLGRERRMADDQWHKKVPPEPKFCPYCAAPTPKLEKAKDPPKDISVVTDGGYYCDTCQERLNACMCLPPEAVFKPVSG